MRIFTKSALLAAGIAGAALLAGCTDGYGRGYSSVSVGYNAGWGDPYWGWYDDYYYPGTGIYIYARDGRRYRWSDNQRYYWENRRSHWRGDRRWRSRWDGYRGRRRR